MAILRVLIEVEHENEIPEGSQQIAADIGAQRTAESVEESGGGPVLAARGVIQSGEE